VLARLGFPPDAFVLGYIGTLFTYESLDLLIGAVAGLRAQLPQLRVVLVGDGDAGNALRTLVAQRRLESVVTFTGRVPHEAVGEYYSLIDLFVLPRRRNRLSDLVTPLKPLEIMARAKPLLASDCGGHVELVADGMNGFTFRADDEAALAERIRALSQRRDVLATIGQSAHRWVLRHRSWRAMVQPTVDLYSQLLVGARGVGQAPVADSHRLST
jgi:glycosyltransferase involved in cell wall biosynthesis